MPTIDLDDAKLLKAGRVDDARALLERQVPLSIFGSRDHGDGLLTAGLSRAAGLDGSRRIRFRRRVRRRRTLGEGLDLAASCQPIAKQVRRKGRLSVSDQAPIGSATLIDPGRALSVEVDAGLA